MVNIDSNLKDILDMYARAQRFNHRILIYITNEVLGCGLISKILTNLNKPELVFIYRDKGDQSTTSILNELTNSNVSLKEFEFKSLNQLLGSTYDALLLDLTNHMNPNDIGLAVELVRGGGFILIAGPSMESLDSWNTVYHNFFVSPPYSVEQVTKRFEKRLLKKTIGRSGIVYIASSQTIIGGNWQEPTLEEHGKIVGNLFPQVLYDMCLSYDQMRVLNAFESLKENIISIVIKANRGRGKSAVLGLALSGLISRTDMNTFLVSAPTLANVQTLFEFALKGLETLDLKPQVLKKEEFYRKIKVGQKVIEYISPYNIVRRKGDLVIIDEAAGIPLPILIGVMKRFGKAVYSTTVHGYEGAGRSFSVLFMNRLRSKRKAVLELEMNQPIRYAQGDPIESWLYDVLILDAEEPEITSEVTNVSYSIVNKDELFENNEDLLRQIIGLYITTHYRNKPDDIALLANSPHHEVRILKSDDGKVVGAAHLALEGGLKDSELKLLEDRDLKGQLIPSTVVRYYPHLKALGKLNGLRIVRIAVHSKLQNRGYGSLLLSNIEEEFKKLDWLGSSFGANPRLLNFWFKNGYYPIAIGARRNPVSGEFSTVVIKPLSNPSLKLCEELSREFRLRLIESLYDSYFNMDSELVWLLLSKTLDQYEVKLEFKGSQRFRLESFIKDLVIYEGASDSIKALVRAHFLASHDKRLGLNKDIERFLILKVLQGRSWEAVQKIIGSKFGSKTINDLRALMKDTVQKLYDKYV